MTIIANTHTNRITTAKREKNSLQGKNKRKEVPWLRIGLLQVNHLAPRPAGKIGHKLEVHGERAAADEIADKPIYESKTGRTSALEDG